MLTPIYTNKFQKDINKIKKSGSKDFTEFKKIVELLINQMPLEPKHKDHKLIGNHIGRRDCHVEPDWIIIYMIQNDSIIFERTGTHSELFK